MAGLAAVARTAAPAVTLGGRLRSGPGTASSGGRAAVPDANLGTGRRIVSRLCNADPRLYQLAVLGGLVVYGLGGLDFDIAVSQVVVIFAVALGTQWGCSLATGIRFDPRSALISSCSLSLLLRTNAWSLAAVGAAAAIASKFVFRLRGKHLFNPANFGIVLLLALTEGVWVSPGQWGNVALFAFFLGCLGTLVVTRAARADVTVAFLVAYVGLVVGRAWWVGDPMSIPVHRLQSGALLLFAFFMISDPKTTPDSRVARVFFAVAVACVAWYIAFRLFRNNGLMWALAAATPMVPVLDRWLPGPRYEWSDGRAPLAAGRDGPGSAGTSEAQAPSTMGVR